jgi:hypothetical protein
LDEILNVQIVLYFGIHNLWIGLSGVGAGNKKNEQRKKVWVCHTQFTTLLKIGLTLHIVVHSF